MGKNNPLMITPPETRLLALCARLTSDDEHSEQIARTAVTITNWRGLLQLAESLNMGPLLYHHLQASQVPLPVTTRRELKGLYLRHQHANQVRSQVISELLVRCEQARIKAILLKGAALAFLVYPQPGLRPMRDIDLLVDPAQAWNAQQILREMGFDAPEAYAAGKPYHHHLANATKIVDGLSTSVEIHHTVFLEGLGVSLDMSSLTAPPVSVRLPGGRLGQTLGPEDMLWHICHHMIDILHPFRWIWLVDMVATAEHFVDQIDWPRLKRQYRRVVEELSVLNEVTPLSDRLLAAAGINIGDLSRDIGHEFSGWPRHDLKHLRQHRNWFQILRDTFWPPEWWLRLYYGVGTGRSLFWTRWGRHPLQIAKFVRQLLVTKGA